MGDERPCGPPLGYEAAGEGFLLASAPVFCGKDGSAGKAGGERCCLDVTLINVTAALLPVH